MAKFHGVVEAVIAGTPRECRPEERGGLGDVRVEWRCDMRGHVSSLTVVIAAAVLVLTACGAGDADTEAPTPNPAWSQGAVPTGNQLAPVLLTSDDLPGQWKYTRGRSGVFVFCPQAPAESIQAADGLTWAANVQLDQIPDGATAAASPSPSTPVITVDQWLLAEDPTKVEGTFTALRDGIDACFGPSSMTAQGVVGTPDGAPLVGAPMAVPPVGDDRIGEFDTYPQGFPGSTNPESPAYLHTAIIRDGPVLMAINIAEENASPTEQQLTQDDIDAIITTAAAKLPKPVTRSTPEP